MRGHNLTSHRTFLWSFVNSYQATFLWFAVYSFKVTSQCITPTTFKHPQAYSIYLIICMSAPYRLIYHLLPKPCTSICIQQYHGLINLSTWLIELMPFNSVKVIRNLNSAFASLAFMLKGDVQGVCLLFFTVFFSHLNDVAKKHQTLCQKSRNTTIKCQRIL